MDLDEFFKEDPEDPAKSTPQNLGTVVNGSLKEGIEVRLNGNISVEDMAVGRYVAIEGEKQRFFGMITDVSLSATDAKLTIMPPDMSDPFIAEVLAGTSTYGTLKVIPMLTMSHDASALLDGPQPVKTVPTHFSQVREATDEDVSRVFGDEKGEHHFYVGTPLDMETKVCLDLKRFVERSSGIFGKSGTGKTFLTRILLIGMAQKSQAVNLIFDMHNEYGWQGSSESGIAVKGMKQLFPSRVAIFTLDEESARRRQVSFDFAVEIGYDQIEPEDIEMLKESLNLSPRAMDAIHALSKKFGEERWLEIFLDMESPQERDQLAVDIGMHEGTLRALYMSLGRLKRLKFLAPRARVDSVKNILDYLSKGINVVLEFGRYMDITAYMLVANVLTRRIHAQYVERTERSMSGDAEKPQPLVITIEEAHKFLNPEVAKQTIFGTIAREMRKYNVTLLVVDQRPSGIDEEIMSQIGTRITCLLDNEKDIDSVLMGVSGRNELRAVLAKLETKQQALILGHAVPMPVVIKTREYGSEESYKTLGSFGMISSIAKDGELKPRKSAKDLLFPD